MRDIYCKLKDSILSLSPTITVKAKKMYIAFTNNVRNFIYLGTTSIKLELHLSLRKGGLKDPKKMAKDISTKRNRPSMTEYLINVNEKSDFGHIISLIIQAYAKTK
jgi:predicted transport protein